MNLLALFCDGTGNYVFPPEPLPGQQVTLQFRTAADDVDSVCLLAGGREYEMEKRGTAGIFDFYAVTFTLGNENLLKLNMLLNTTLNGMSIEEINLGLIARLKEQAGIHSEVISDVLDAVADAIQIDDEMQIYTSGATNIFKYPELSDKQSAQEIISAFEEKQQLTELVTQTLSQEDNTGIQVYIGDESPVQTM